MINPEHLEALRTKHASLEAEIDEENQRPHPDDIRLHELKKKKLHIKETLNRLQVDA